MIQQQFCCSSGEIGAHAGWQIPAALCLKGTHISSLRPSGYSTSSLQGYGGGGGGSSSQYEGGYGGQSAGYDAGYEQGGSGYGSHLGSKRDAGAAGSYSQYSQVGPATLGLTLLV